MITSLCLIMLLAAPQKTASQYPAQSAQNAPILGFFKAATAIMDAGPGLWDKIGKYQAGNVVQDVATGASNLEVAKSQLQADILAGRIKDGNELKLRVGEIQEQLTDFQDALKKFAVEIDKSSENLGNDIRVSAQKEISAKGTSLDRAKRIWSPNDKENQRRSAKAIGTAIACTKQIEIVASCLSNTVRDGKRDTRPVCTASALQADTEACEVEANPNLKD